MCCVVGLEDESGWADNAVNPLAPFASRNLTCRTRTLSRALVDIKYVVSRLLPPPLLFELLSLDEIRDPTYAT
jgi:hypothetical protein